jgi:hypothetical protein
VATGTGGAVVLDSDFLTPTLLAGSANATNILLEQLPWAPPGAWVRAGTGFGNTYSNLTYWGF